MKKIAAAGFMVMLIGGTVLTGFAGSWQQDGSGWWYRNDDGSYPKSEWVWIDGDGDGVSECYYFDDNGYCLMNTTTPEGYTVDGSGAWVVDGAVQTKGQVSVDGLVKSKDAGQGGYDVNNGLGKAYADRVRELNQEYGATQFIDFALAYIDEDDVPELIVSVASGTYRVATNYIYGYQNGTAPRIAALSVSGLEYVPRKNYMKIARNEFRAQYYQYAAIAGGQLQSIHECDEVHGNTTSRYTVDGKDVSEQEYEAQRIAFDNAGGGNYVDVNNMTSATEDNLSKLESNPASFALG